MRNQAPILDEAYMAHRAAQEAFRHQMDQLGSMLLRHRVSGSASRTVEPKDEQTKARDAYLAGEITAEALEIRLNTAFGLPAYQSVRAA